MQYACHCGYIHAQIYALHKYYQVFPFLITLAVHLLQGDFCHMEFEDNTFDGIFCFEATCHAGRLADVYKEIARVLKPGGVFVDCAWVVTDSYDPQNPEHVKVHDDIVVS